MGWRSVAVPLLCLVTAGCTVSSVDLRDALDLNQASFRDKLASQQELIDEFSQLRLDFNPSNPRP